MPAKPTFVLDADVLIDYRDSDLTILELVARHVGRVVVLRPVLYEVKDFTEMECTRLGIEILDVETNRLLHAAGLDEPTLSFTERLCMDVCAYDGWDEGWVYVTNDEEIKYICLHHPGYGITRTSYGLDLLTDLVAAGTLSPKHAMSVALQIRKSNPMQITEKVFGSFTRFLHKI